jgi:hypothetical protein
MRRREDTPEGKIRRHRVAHHEKDGENYDSVESHFSDIPAEVPAAGERKRFSRRQRASKSKRSRRH